MNIDTLEEGKIYFIKDDLMKYSHREQRQGLVWWYIFVDANGKQISVKSNELKN